MDGTLRQLLQELIDCHVLIQQLRAELAALRDAPPGPRAAEAPGGADDRRE